MANHKKNSDDKQYLLVRVRDLSHLVSGTIYHLRKPIKKEEKVWWDEVHDIVLGEVLEGSLIEKDTDFEFPSNEYDIFLKKEI